MAWTTRFAPSPTGFLHLGHLYSALHVWKQGQLCLLRIEDIDHGRCKTLYEVQIIEDLRWLGFEWHGPVLRQSERMGLYVQALEQLHNQGLLYPCFCTRKEMRAQALSAPHGQILRYNGRCKGLSTAVISDRIAQGMAHTWRLNMDQACALYPHLTWQELDFKGKVHHRPCEAYLWGDVVIARKDITASYHLAVCVDDDAQGVTLVTRGVDLYHATSVQRLLQALLGLASPCYAFHPLLLDAQGKRFAKRDKAKTLKAFRAEGYSPGDLKKLAMIYPNLCWNKS